MRQQKQDFGMACLGFCACVYHLALPIAVNVRVCSRHLKFVCATYACCQYDTKITSSLRFPRHLRSTVKNHAHKKEAAFRSILTRAAPWLEQTGLAEVACMLAPLHGARRTAQPGHQGLTREKAGPGSGCGFYTRQSGVYCRMRIGYAGLLFGSGRIGRCALWAAWARR